MSKFKIDFIWLGAPKSGTTTIAKWLEEHPQISLYPHKEINYFSNHTRVPMPSKDKYALGGIEWYKKLFENTVDFSKTVWEFSVYYIYSELAADRIKEYFPDVKLIIAIREPISRCYSMYNMDKNLYQDMDLSFEEAIAKHPEYIESCKYSKYLKMYLDRFPKKNIKIILLDDLKNNSELTASELFKFLWVDNVDNIDSLWKTINPAQVTKSRCLKKITWFFIKTARKLDNSFLWFIPKIWRKIWLVFILRKVDRKNKKDKGIIPSMKKETRQMLAKEFEEDILACEKILNRDLSAWKL